MKYYFYINGRLIDVFDSMEEARNFAKKFYPDSTYQIIPLERRS